MKLTRVTTYLVTLSLILTLTSPIMVTPVRQTPERIGSHGTIKYSMRICYGVASHPWVLTKRDFEEMKILRVKYVRIDFIWQDFQPTRGAAFRFFKYDQYVEWAKSNSLEVIALMVYVPPWFTSLRSDQFTIPSGSSFNEFVAEYGEFVYTVVDHYKDDITYFEIWNEANLCSYWNDSEGTLERGRYNRGFAVAKYVKLLKESFIRAKAANPSSRIISSGLGENDYVFVQQMYENGVKGYFDYLGLHPYFWHGPIKNYDPDYVDWDNKNFEQFPKIELVRNVMVSCGDDDKHIFVTELGIGNSNGPQGVTTEEMRADRLRRLFEIIDHDPGYRFVNAVIWYQFRDSIASPSYAFSLLREDYNQTRMYYAYFDVINSR